jgi:carbon-monoxide dehydrogenase medium subunit
LLQITSYLKPASAREAAVALSAVCDARAMAGGTDLLVAAREKGLPLKAIVDLKTIPEMAHIRGDRTTGIRIGALATLHDIERSPVLAAGLPHLVEAASLVGSYPIRNRATLGGNLCNASPAADTACPLLSVGAVVTLECCTGKRVLPLNQFFTGAGRSALASAELLTEISCPALDEPDVAYGSAYVKLGPRSAMDIAVVNVAVMLGMREGRIAHAGLALGSVAPIPVRLTDLEAELSNREPDENLILATARRAQGLVRPITDIRASAWYRGEMVREILAQAIRIALGRALNHG